MKLHTILLSLGLMAAAILPARAEVQNLYLSPTGSDANAGTKAAPLATIGEVRSRIERLCAAADRPDSVKIFAEAGTYALHRALVITPELTRGVPLIFEGDTEGKTVFSGGQRLAPFTQVNDRLWKTFVPAGFTFEQLYVNGQRRFRAKSPNHGEFHGIRALKENVVDSTGNWQTMWSLLQVEPDSMPRLSERGEGEPALVTFYHKWTITRRHVLHTDDSGRFYCAGKGLQPWNRMDNRTRFIIENDRKLLDAPGEWFLDGDGWLYYIPCEGETPENTVCTAPVTEKFLVLKGSEDGGHLENVSFRNIAFEHSGHRTPITGYDSPQGASEAGAVIEAEFARNIRLQNCTVAHTGLYGIWFRQGCSDSQVEHCHLYDLGAGGVKIGHTNYSREKEHELTHHITVDNCIIQHGGKVFPPAVGVIIFHASDNRITHNDIADFRYTGVSVGWHWGYGHSPSKRNIIEYNHIHHLGWGELSDMGGVYTLGPSEGSSVSHNHVHHVYSLYYGGWGLYTDEGSSGIMLQNNLVYRCKSGGFHQHYGKDNIVRNNIFAGQIRTQLEATRVEEHTSFVFEHNIVAYDSGTLCGINWEQVGHRSDHNCYFDSRTPDIRFKDIAWADWQKKGQDRHSVVADPKFADAENFDFTPTNKRMLKKIGFKPFDPHKAGVYGSDEWKNRAQLSQETLQAFDNRVREYEEMGKTDW